MKKRRDENLKGMDKLHYVAEEIHELVIVSYNHPNEKEWYVTYFDRQQAGQEPVSANCRDDKDYDLLWNQWRKRGMIDSKWYPSFQDMIAGETTQLRKENAV